MKLICSEVGKAGLKVNQGKCELFGPRFDPAELLQGLAEVPLVHESGFELLGAPVEIKPSASPTFGNASRRSRGL